jgi:hypothetical protein
MTDPSVVDDPLGDTIAAAIHGVKHISTVDGMRPIELHEVTDDRIRATYDRIARRVLAAIAATGRLLPEGGELRVEWGVRSERHAPSPEITWFYGELEGAADESLKYRRDDAPDFLRDPDAVKVTRRVWEERWQEVTS